jgi:hypothetical protein
MKLQHRVGLLILAAFVLFVHANFAGQDQRPTLNPSGQSQRPSLGAAPSLNGPVNAKIINAGQLLRVHKVFVESIDNKLSLKLDQAFGKLGPFQVASSLDQADAVLRGTCFDSPHLKEVHSEVYLTSKTGSAIWQDVIRQPYDPPSLSQVVDETANLVIEHLRQSLQQARHR